MRMIGVYVDAMISYTATLVNLRFESAGRRESKDFVGFSDCANALLTPGTNDAAARPAPAAMPCCNSLRRVIPIAAFCLSLLAKPKHKTVFAVEKRGLSPALRR